MNALCFTSKKIFPESLHGWVQIKSLSLFVIRMVDRKPRDLPISSVNQFLKLNYSDLRANNRKFSFVWIEFDLITHLQSLDRLQKQRLININTLGEGRRGKINLVVGERKGS